MREHVHDRRIYVAEHAAAVMPGSRDDVIPKERLFDLATKDAAKNGLYQHPYFGKAKDPRARFRSYIEHNWGGADGIRSIMLSEVGVATDFGHGLLGVRRAGKRGAAATNAWLLRCVAASIASYNALAEGSHTVLAVEAQTIQTRLLALNGGKK